QGISRKHFKITVVEAKDSSIIEIEDLESKNGTFINNRKMEEKLTLRKGDIIKVGDVALKFIPKGDPERVTYDKLQTEAITDGLTKCFNKKYFLATFEQEFLKAKKNNSQLSVVVFDLDKFKNLND